MTIFNRKIKKALLFAAVIVLTFSLGATVYAEQPAQKSAVSDDPLVTLSYVNEVLKPQIIAEILQRTGNGSVPAISTGESVYQDIYLERGKMIKLGADCEFIYRGGGAVIITTSPEKGDGVSDMSTGMEFFSGKPLEFGHVYYASESEAEKYILITGSKAYFTIRGTYEIC
ncbi:MAG TPA: hypothetical protein PLD48_09355 [Bacillota bacterium]|nr:hypothetical protein [Bacillota bacterium]HOK69700.1 hypothetical protein [Bacillota bacterium]HPP86097.1 hypothetical protein [Bacillota bacterium]